jgi:hypothetical protein
MPERVQSDTSKYFGLDSDYYSLVVAKANDLARDGIFVGWVSKRST